MALFILGMGLGAVLSPRIRNPYRIELFLAVFALCLGLFPEAWLQLSARVISGLSTVLPAAAAAVVFGVALAGPAAVLLGVTFPALVEREGDVAQPYLLQAAGSLAGIVLVEAFLFPFGGLRLAFCFIALLHLSAAVLLRPAHWRFESHAVGRPVLSLVLAGTFTGVFQGTWLFLALLIFNPFYFIQPTVVIAMLAGLFAGARLYAAKRWTFSRALEWTALGVGLSAVLAGVATQLPMAPSFGWAIPALLVLVVAGAVPIGSIYPAFFGRVEVDRARAGAGLLSLAVGNVLGLATVGAFTAMLPVAWLFVVAAAGLALLSRARGFIPVVGVGLAILGAALSGDRALMSRERSFGVGPIEVEHIIRGPGELTGIYSRKLGDVARMRRLYQSGFSPIDLSHGQEVSIGLAATAYAPAHQRALVIGAGSGKTAGVIARAFERTEVFDVGVTVRPLLEYLSAENYQLLEQPGVRYWALDGLLAPYVVEPGLDLIVLTVDPAYHFKAAKLYAEESLRSLKQLLRPGGVLVFWADATTDAHAAQALLNTGAAVFREQRLFLAAGGPRGRRLLNYFFLVHSDEPIVYGFDRPAVARVVALDDATRLHAEPAEEFRLPAPGRLHETTSIHRLVSPDVHILIGGFQAKPLQVQGP